MSIHDVIGLVGASTERTWEVSRGLRIYREMTLLIFQRVRGVVRPPLCEVQVHGGMDGKGQGKGRGQGLRFYIKLRTTLLSNLIYVVPLLLKSRGLSRY